MNLKRVKLIASEEWKSINRQKVLIYLVFIIVAVLSLAAYIGWENVHHHNEEQEHYQSEVVQQWENQPDRHPHRVSHYGYLVFRDKYPLSAFDFGVNSYVGNSVFLEAHRQNTMNMSDASFSNGILRFGELSMALIFQLILPLFIIFIGFGSVSGLKQNGVLKLILVQNTTYKDIIFGKTLGIYAVTMAYFLPILIFGIAFTGLMSGADAEGLIPRAFLLVASYSVYFLIFSFVVVVFSALNKTPKSTLLVLLIIWFSMVFILPKAAQTLGANIYEAPNKNDFDISIHNQIKKEGDSHNPDDQHFKELKEEILKKYNVSSIEELPINYGGLVFAEGEKITTKIFGEKFEELIKIYQNQNKVSEFLGFANPYLAMRNMSMGFSGSSFSDAVSFQRQAEKYRYDRTQYLNKLQQEEIKYYKESQKERTQRINNELLKQMPPFKYQHFSTYEILKEQILGISAFVFMLFVLVLAANYIQKNSNKFL